MKIYGLGKPRLIRPKTLIIDIRNGCEEHDDGSNKMNIDDNNL